MTRTSRLQPLQSTLLPPYTGISGLRVATYNIHKGVSGVGPRKRLEIHNLGLAIEALDADMVFLQEVRLFNHQEARRFARAPQGWPNGGQADYLAPEGYEVAYRTNAVTRQGEHGNALLSRWPLGDVGHRDVSDHRFEQRGLLHVPVSWNGVRVHAVVVHLGLVHASRVRQVQRMQQYIQSTVPEDELLVVAGDFNDWGEKLDGPMADLGLTRAFTPPQGAQSWPGNPLESQSANQAASQQSKRATQTLVRARLQQATFPSLAPVFALDRFYLRGLACTATMVPRGLTWARMSDHLPLVAELQLA